MMRIGMIIFVVVSAAALIMALIMGAREDKNK